MKCPFDNIGHLITAETKIEKFPKNFILIDIIQKREHEETFNINTMISEDKDSLVSINLDGFLDKMQDRINSASDSLFLKNEIKKSYFHNESNLNVLVDHLV